MAGPTTISTSTSANPSRVSEARRSAHTASAEPSSGSQIGVQAIIVVMPGIPIF
jgi:hypothetical protein